MTDFEVWMGGRRYEGLGSASTLTYYGFDKNSILAEVKRDAEDSHADVFNIYYKKSGNLLGIWEKKGSKWYKRRE